MDFTKEEREVILSIWSGEKASHPSPSAATIEDNIDDFQEHIQYQACNVYDYMWNQRYRELSFFWMSYGHSSVPQRYDPNPALGKWVHKQRHLLKKACNGEATALSPLRIKALRRVNFQADPQKRAQSSWMKRYHELVSFKEICGHCNVPQKYAENEGLGRWVHKQRHDLWKEMKKVTVASMSKERLFLLVKIGFVWSSRREQNNSMQKRIMSFLNL